jgi:hypothetical protein
MKFLKILSNWWAEINTKLEDQIFYDTCPWVLLIHADIGSDGTQIAPEYHETETEAMDSLMFPDDASEERFYMLLDAELLPTKEYERYQRRYYGK